MVQGHIDGTDDVLRIELALFPYVNDQNAIGLVHLLKNLGRDPVNGFVGLVCFFPTFKTASIAQWVSARMMYNQ